jgi:Spy/CpxP family protein refolding chaperone
MNRDTSLRLVLLSAVFLSSYPMALKAEDRGEAAEKPSADTTGSVAKSAATRAKPVANPPFLISQGMPHLVGPIMKRWDDPALGLDATQKQALLRSREATMTQVKRLSAAISTLEAQVVEGSASGRAPDELRAFVDEISKLKAEATMVHLRCLHESRAILSPRQLDVLSRAKAP